MWFIYDFFVDVAAGAKRKQRQCDLSVKQLILFFAPIIKILLDNFKAIFEI